MNRRECASYVHVHLRSTKFDCRSGAASHTELFAEPASEGRVANSARGEERNRAFFPLLRSPSLFCSSKILFPLFNRRCPGVIWSPRTLRLGSLENKSPCS